MSPEPRSESPEVIVSPYVRKGTMVRLDQAVIGLGVVLVFHDDEDRRLWLDHPERWEKVSRESPTADRPVSGPEIHDLRRGRGARD